MESERCVGQDVDQHAAGPARDERAEYRIVQRSDDHLDPVRHHLLHEGAGHVVTEARGEICKRCAQTCLIADVQRDCAPLRFVQQRRTERLQGDWESQLRSCFQSIRNTRHDPRRSGCDTGCGKQ